MDWSYAGANGPAHWATLAEAYSGCGGREQSPINLVGYVEGYAAPLAFSYGALASSARADGRALHVDFPGVDTLVSGGRTYRLVSMHMHAPAEHTVDGEQFAAELHLVHADPGGALAVVGLLFAPGAASPAVQAFLDAAPPAGEAVNTSVAIE